jgi:predicted LPLAT superfamily acyltransferase
MKTSKFELMVRRNRGDSVMNTELGSLNVSRAVVTLTLIVFALFSNDASAQIQQAWVDGDGAVVGGADVLRSRHRSGQKQ